MSKLTETLTHLRGGGPWEDDGTRSDGWTTGSARHVSDMTLTVELPGLAEVEEILFLWESGEWDGESTVVLRLDKGRFMSWQSWWGPTGAGFSEDAYGGDADVWIADSFKDIMRLGLTNEGRADCVKAGLYRDLKAGCLRAE